MTTLQNIVKINNSLYNYDSLTNFAKNFIATEDNIVGAWLQSAVLRLN